MQVQESSPEPSPVLKDGPLKVNLKPAKRRGHIRSGSRTSEESKNEGQASNTTEQKTEISAEEESAVTNENKQEQSTEAK